MNSTGSSRRGFLKGAGWAAGALALKGAPPQTESGAPDYTIRIKASPVEIAPNYILSTITYNGQFPGPLLRFQEGRQVTVDIYNDTDTPEQLHWHGQLVPTDVDGAAEEATSNCTWTSAS
jgi:FtsP/CotA-like multicopper oxidase with cupredoxin domain